MSKYKIIKMGNVYTLNRISKESWGTEYIPSRPVKYFKNRAGAIREAKKRGFKLE